MYHFMLSVFFALMVSMPSSGQSTAKNIWVDNLGNVYIIQKDNISKFSNNGEPIAKFSYKNAGEIASIDVTDPLKIVVFYKSFGQLIFLDNTLSITNGPVSLFEKEVINPVLVCASSDKGIWIYDKQNFTIFKFDENLQQLLRVTDLSATLETDLEPVFMMSLNSFLYISDPKKGIFVFDQYGSFYKLLHFKDIYYFDIFDNSLFYNDNGVFKKIDLLTYSELTMDLKEKLFSSQTFKDVFVYLLNAEGTGFSKIKMSFSKK